VKRRAQLYEQGLAMSGDEAVAHAIDAVNRYLAADSQE
jgi:hypothetical protein